MRFLLPFYLAALGGCAVPEPAALPAPPHGLPADARPDSETSWPGREAPAADVRLTVEPGTAYPGGFVTLLLRNNSPYILGFNLCLSPLELRQGDAWRFVYDEEGFGCAKNLQSIPPRGEARHRTRLPSRLPAGEYRFETNLEIPLNSPGMRRVFSNSFAVRR